MRTILQSVFLCFLMCSVTFAADVPSPVDNPEVIPDLLKLLDAEDEDRVIAAYMSLSDYYCHPAHWIGEKPEIDRELFKRQASSWHTKFKGMTRKQILLARLGEEPTHYILKYVPEILPTDEAMDYLVDWALSDRKERIWGLHNLHYLTGLDLLGAHTPKDDSIAFACSYWKQAKSLGHDDRARLMAMGRLLTRKRHGFPISKRLSESEARMVFRKDEDRSLELWQQFFDLLPPWANTLKEGKAYKSGTVGSRQYETLVVLAKVNSPKSVALLTRIGNEQRDPWLKDNVQNLLYNLGKYPDSVMEEPVEEQQETGPTKALRATK
ncbi:MAG: hypothetical protein WCP86_09810 [bacterium]